MVTSVIKLLPIEISKLLVVHKLDKLTEIRLRVGQKLVFRFGKVEVCERYVVRAEDITNVLGKASSNSIYAIQEDLNLGYITIEGGNRIGITGELVTIDGKIKNMKNISSMNIRISHELNGIALPVINKMIDNGNIKNTLIISPPGCGKTTLLRDCIRLISDYGKNVGVADERGEIASVYCGTPTLNVGSRTDVISFCSKARGMNMLLRSMSPDVIATDEIGSDEDVESINKACTCGVSVIATAHAKTLDDCLNNKSLSKLLEKKCFELVLVLSNNQKIGTIEEIIEINKVREEQLL